MKGARRKDLQLKREEKLSFGTKMGARDAI